MKVTLTKYDGKLELTAVFIGKAAMQEALEWFSRLTAEPEEVPAPWTEKTTIVPCASPTDLLPAPWDTEDGK